MSETFATIKSAFYTRPIQLTQFYGGEGIWGGVLTDHGW